MSKTDRHHWMERTIPELKRQINQALDHLKQGPVRKRFGLGTGTLPLGQGDEVITPIGQFFDEIFVSDVQDFNLSYEIWYNPSTRNHVIVETLHEKMDKAKVTFAKLYNAAIKSNPMCTRDDLAAMGLPVYEDKTMTPSPIPDSLPAVVATSPFPAVVRIAFTYSDGYRPRSIHGAEILYSVLDHQPEDWSELIHSDFATSSPHDLVFSGFEQGKTLYFSLRWENNRGQKGPRGAIHSILIN